MMVPIFTLNINAELAAISVVENTRGHAMRAALIAMMLMFGSQATADVVIIQIFADKSLIEQSLIF